MGDQADMMLDGTLCVQCGVYVGGPADVPVTCSDCAADSGSAKKRGRRRKKRRPGPEVNHG